MNEPTWRLSDVPEGIRSGIEIDPLCGCWRFTRGKPSNALGHMRIKWRGENWWVHRLVFTLLVGPIGPGLTLDHVKAWGCRWNDCCWPGHLEPVTRAENLRRGATVPSTINAAKTVCPKGHRLVPGNLYLGRWRRTGHRECLTCKRALARERGRLARAPQRAALAAKRAERKAAVARLRGEGLSVRETAERLGISTSTVRANAELSSRRRLAALLGSCRREVGITRLQEPVEPIAFSRLPLFALPSQNCLSRVPRTAR